MPRSISNSRRPKIVLLSFADSDLSALAAAPGSRMPGILPTLRLASLRKLKHPMSVDLYVERPWSRRPERVIVRCLGGFEYWRYGLEIIASIARKNNIAFAALPGDDRPDPRLAEISTVNAKRRCLVWIISFVKVGRRISARH